MIGLLFILLCIQGGCDKPTHSHSYSDLRFAKVVVTSVSECGIGVEDIQEHTICSSCYQFDEKFTAAIIKNSPGESVVRVVPKTTIKKGIQGVIIYCSHCKAVLTIQIQEEKE